MRVKSAKLGFEAEASNPSIANMQDKALIKKISPVEYRVEKGFVPNMRVPGFFYVNERLKELIFEELQLSYSRDGAGGFLPAVKQLANVAALPGVVEASIAFSGS